MLKKEQESYLKDTLGMDIEALKGALTSDEEVEIKYKSGTFLDDDGLDRLKQTVKSEGYNEGKVAGVEIKAKEIKEKKGIDIEGKDFDKIFDHFEKSILDNAKIEPNKKNQELQDSLKKLQDQYTTDIDSKDSQIATLTDEKTQIKSNNDLLRNVPENLKGITSKQFATLAKSEYSFDYDDNGKFVAKQGDAILKDKLENPLEVKDVLTDYAAKNNWFTAEGRGGENEGGKTGQFETMHDVYKHMETNKIDPMSPDGQQLVETFKNK